MGRSANGVSTIDVLLKILNYLLVLTLVPVCRCTILRCTTQQIEVVKNGTTKACMACPPCRPGFEYSLACGTKVDVSTNAICRRCPQGKYSSGFDSKPCVSCTRCSTGRVVLRNCTRSQNAKCSRDCKLGYYRKPVVFDCHKCIECCNDGKDVTTKGCAVMGMCRERPLGCPAVTNSPTTLTLNDVTPSKVVTQFSGVKHTPDVKQSVDVSPTPKDDVMHTVTPSPVRFSRARNMTLTGTTASATTPGRNPLVPPSRGSKAVNGSGAPTTDDGEPYEGVSLLLYIPLGLLLFVLLVLLVVGLLVFYKKWRRDKVPSQLPAHLGQVQVLLQHMDTPEPPCRDVLVSEWLNRIDNVDAVCRMLNGENNGRYVYERVGMGAFGYSQNQIADLKNEFKRSGGSPAMAFLEKLEYEKPDLTVRQLAEAIKDKGKLSAAYTLMEPYFTCHVTSTVESS